MITRSRTRSVLTLVAVAMAIFGLTTTSASAAVVLRVDFNSNQDSGGDSTTAGDPGLSAAAHNQAGWSSYHANHEVIDEFATADYGGITVTPDWPNTTDNRVRQSIDRGSGNDGNWDDAAGDINLVTDFIGIDTRTGNGGNGDWDGAIGTPTYMTLALGGLAAGNYGWTSFHHDTEHCHGPFAVWLSTDGGATFAQLADGIMTDSTPGGSPDSGATEVGPDAYSLSSTYSTSFSADGVNAVVFRFAPYSEGAVHRQIWGMNGFVLEPRIVLLSEDFEGLPLDPNVDEGLAGDAVWTDTPPEGWTVDESSIPGIGNPLTDGVTEWAGWAFADKAWWIEAAEDQNRSQFELGSGTVAVADPDEWDDADRLPIPIEADPYDTWLTTPAIDIFGLEDGTLQLKFDSSWRPEFDDNYHQTATITASFDGGVPVEVLRWESDGGSDNFKPDSTNETVVVDLDVPLGASSVVLEFGLIDAGNDWWWAIDNVEVSGVPREKIVVLSEDFEGLDLGPNVDESVVGDQVWTDTPPEGWTIDESGVPGIGDPATDGVTEWAGWALADKAWWIEAAEDQNRSQFELASGTVAVADPDEWDDADHADSAAAGWYKTFLATPEIDISALEAGSLKLTFASSWRPEFDSNYHQTANITASFDGGDPVEVLLWESDGGSANFKPDSTNETVVVRIPNPAGAKTVVLEFGLFDAGNDWWWAIDNVEVSGLAPLPLMYDGGVLDDAWDHDNGSDAWDGTGPGEGNPGGAASLTEDDVTFLRIQDTGDPRDYGMDDPSNRKVYFTRQIGIGLDGARLEFRARVADSAPLDDMHPDGGGGIAPWPVGGIGYHIRDGGKGMFGISDGVQIISFSLAQAGEIEGVETDALVMSGLLGAEASGDVDTGEAATANVLAIDDASAWNDIVIDITAGGAGTHVVAVSVNGADAQSFEVTSGDGTESDDPFVAIGSSGTGGITAFDVDYVAAGLTPVPAPVPVGHWTLDDGAGTTVADVSGNGNDGTIMDNPDLPDPTWIDGVYGGALEFHGTGVAGTGGDFIDCGNDASLDITGPISIALWIRPDADDPEGKGTSGGETAPMAKATSDWSYQVRYGWGGAPTPYMSFTFNTSPRAWASVGRNLDRFEWCHIACSYDGTTLRCYLDGVETDSTPMGEIHSSADPVLIGSDGWKSDWTGGIDDVRIYDQGLSPDQILDIVAGL